MNGSLDVSKQQNDSALDGRYFPAQQWPEAECKQPNLEDNAAFFAETLAYRPSEADFTLRELQCEIAMGYETPEERKRILKSDFALMLDVAEDFDWIRELPEDKRVTKFYQEKYQTPSVRYGRTFAYSRNTDWINAEKIKFVKEFVMRQWRREYELGR